MKIWTVDDPVFKTAALFVVGCEFPKFHTYMQKRWRYEAGEDAGQIGQMFTLKKTPHRVVWSRTGDPAVVVHEIFHLVTRICQDRGIPIYAYDEKGNGDEAAAFLMEFFTRIALRKLGFSFTIRR